MTRTHTLERSVLNVFAHPLNYVVKRTAGELSCFLRFHRAAAAYHGVSALVRSFANTATSNRPARRRLNFIVRRLGSSYE